VLNDDVDMIEPVKLRGDQDYIYESKPEPSQAKVVQGTRQVIY
jgi:hypothetical protein